MLHLMGPVKASITFTALVASAARPPVPLLQMMRKQSGRTDEQALGENGASALLLNKLHIGRGNSDDNKKQEILS
jgi:hypothetical protein